MPALPISDPINVNNAWYFFVQHYVTSQKPLTSCDLSWHPPLHPSELIQAPSLGPSLPSIASPVSATHSAGRRCLEPAVMCTHTHTTCQLLMAATSNKQQPITAWGKCHTDKPGMINTTTINGSQNCSKDSQEESLLTHLDMCEPFNSKITENEGIDLVSEKKV